MLKNVCFQFRHCSWHCITTMTFERPWQNFLGYLRVEPWHFPVYFDPFYKFWKVFGSYLIHQLGIRIVKGQTLKLILPSNGTRNSVVNEFQCFFVFNVGELKSVDMTCKWTCCILGFAWNPILNSSNWRPLISITFFASKYISFNRFKWSFVSCK